MFHFDKSLHWRLAAVVLFGCVFVLQPTYLRAQQTDQPAGNAVGPEPIRANDGLIEVSPDATSAEPSLREFLTVTDVIASVYQSFPAINQARQEYRRADGELLSAYGAFDTNLNAGTLSEPTGFYQNYRNGIGAARQTWWGGNIAAGYRIRRGVY